MTLWMLALLPAALALCLLVALVVSVFIRSWQGERWEVPLEGRHPIQGNPAIQAAA